MAWISGLLDRQASFDAEWLLLAPAAVIDLPCSLVLDLGMLPLTVSEQVWVWFRPAPSCSCSQDPGVPTSHQGHELETQSGHAFR
ncbi:MAG: hypothetical protein JNK49_19965 [Planctomycetes bacterium]|nr:hypothetical protein [Planctomycetota bacterium]